MNDDNGPTPSALEVENRALREENRALRAALQAAGPHGGTLANDGLARFRAVFEHSPLGHKIIGPDLRIRQANAAVAALLGLDSPAALVGRRISEFAHPGHNDDWATLQAALWHHHRPAFALETRLQRPDGSSLWCRVTSVLFPDPGGELGFTTLEDVTVRQHLAEEARLLAAETQTLVQQQQATNKQLGVLNEELSITNEELADVNAELVRVNTELDTFIYAASHDLRTPVANLKGLLTALADHLPADVLGAPPVAPLWGMVQVSVERFGHTLTRMADFGTARQGPAAARERVFVGAILEEVRAEVAPLLAALDGRLEVVLAGEPHAWLPPQHLYSVLLNLVSNALKYHHPDRAPVVRVRTYYDTAKLVVSVQDNGRGLSSDQQGELFHMFRRFHPDVEGTGVGLYLVKKIMDQARGTIRVESRPDHGAIFILVFPT